jgi:hypothetical protein
VPRHARPDILILVAGLRRVVELGLTVLFTDSHANNPLVNYYSDPAQLDRIDWMILQSRDFKRDPEDPGKLARYQAEVLIHRHCPLQGLSGVVCYNEGVEMQVE